MKPGFYHLSEAWYANSCLDSDGDYTDEVMFGMYDENGRTSGEIAMRWIKLSSIVPQLQIFDDAWGVLTMFPNIIAELGDLNGQNITPKQFTQLLLDNGFDDLTARQSPYKKVA